MSIRDHHQNTMRILEKNDVKPLDFYAEDALKSDSYHKELEDYDEQVAALMDPVWKSDFVDHKQTIY